MSTNHTFLIKVTTLGSSFQKALKNNRNDLLKPRSKSKRKIFPLVTDFNPRLPNIATVIINHLHLLQSNEERKEMFPPKSIMPAYRRIQNYQGYSGSLQIWQWAGAPPPLAIALMGVSSAAKLVTCVKTSNTKSAAISRATSQIQFWIPSASEIESNHATR